jgi:hypothetical protein
MRLVSMTVGASSSVDPHRCRFRATTQEQARIEGEGVVRSCGGELPWLGQSQGVVGRNPDGSCAVGRPLLYGVDMVGFSGTLSL